MMKRGQVGWIVRAALLCVGALCLAWPARAGGPAAPDLSEGQDFKLRFSGQYLEYDQERKIAVVKDGAFVEQAGLKLWADTVEGDLERHDMYADGNVTFWRDEERFKADSFAYNTKTHRGHATNVTTRKGPTYIRAHQMVLEPYRILGYLVTTTTDDRNPPSYKVVADRMIMIPRKRIVFRNARFVVGDKTYFKMPTYIVNIANPEAVNRFFFNPAWSPGKGFNVRSYWDYYFSEYAYGRLFFNPSQYDGMNLGASLAYKLAEASTGQLQLTRFQSNILQQTNDRYELKHQQVFSTRSKGTMDMVLTKNQYVDGSAERKLTIGAEGQKQYSDWNTALTYNRLVNLDSGLNAQHDLMQFASVTPKFTFNQIRSHRVFGTSLAGRLDGQVARIDEQTIGHEVDATKGDLTMSFSPKPIDFGTGSHINYNFRQSESAYSTGDLRNFFSFWANSTNKLNRGMSTDFDYVFEKAGGTTPFVSYDTLVPTRHIVTGYWRATHSDRFNATLFQSAYDVPNHAYRNASSNFTFRAPSVDDRSWMFALTPVYDFGDPGEFTTLRLNTLSTNVRVTNPDRWSHNLITNYDAHNRRLGSVTNASDFLLSETLRAELQSNLTYNSLKGGYDLTKLNVALTKDLHAFEARLKWNTIQHEIFLEVYLKFASGKKVSMGVDYDRNMQFVTPETARGWF